MLEVLVAVALGVLAWVLLKLRRGKAGEGAGLLRRQGRAKASAEADKTDDPPTPDPVAALSDLPRRLYVEYRTADGGRARGDVDMETLERSEGRLCIVGYCHPAKARERIPVDRISAFTDRHNNAVYKGARVAAALEAAAVAQEAAAARRAAAGSHDPVAESDPVEAPDAQAVSDRDRALDAFREWAARDDWVLVASLASGRDAQAEILEIAVVSAAGEVLLQQRVAPEGPGSDGASAGSGPGAPASAPLPSWPELHEKVTALLAAAPYVLSYNALFQLRLLEQTAARYDLALPDLEFDCVMQAYAAYRAEAGAKGKVPWPSPGEAAAQEGIAEAGSGAAAEALTAWRLIDKIGGAPDP